MIKKYVVSRNTFPSRSEPVALIVGERGSALDDAMSVVRRYAEMFPGQSFSASDTDWDEVMVLHPTDPSALPIYDGSVFDLGNRVAAGTYECVNPRNLNEGVRTYIIEKSGRAHYAMSGM